MADVADEIRAAVNKNRPDIYPGNFAGFTTAEGKAESEIFLKHRADVRGALIEGHRRIGNGTPWQPTDDRILDIVTTWLDNVHGRRVR